MARYDNETALVVVDVQNDFADSQGSLYVQGGEDVVPFINHEVEEAKGAGALIIYTQDWHPPQTPHFEKFGGVWPVHCVMGTWGAELHPGLRVEGEVVRKGSGGEDGYSGFTVRDPQSGEQEATPLETLLRERGIEKVIVVGLATDYCVQATAADALGKGFQTAVLTEGVRGVDLQPGDSQRALEGLRSQGARIE